MINPQAITIRKKKLAVLILDGRLATGRTAEECAHVLGIPVERFQAYERADAVPSLPEIEALAFFFHLPISHFWGSTALTANGAVEAKTRKLHETLNLRKKIIGALLRKAREEKNLSLEVLSKRTGIPLEDLEQYELGAKNIPLPFLEFLSVTLGRALNEFHDTQGPIGNWLAEQRTLEQVSAMPDHLKDFVFKPINRPYLEIAKRLSEIDVDRLRAVAEGLLEITL